MIKLVTVMLSEARLLTVETGVTKSGRGPGNMLYSYRRHFLKSQSSSDGSL